MASLLPDAAPVGSVGDPIYLPASRDALPVHRFPVYEGECCSLIRHRDGDLAGASPHIGQQVVQGRIAPTLSHLPSEDRGYLPVHDLGETCHTHERKPTAKIPGFACGGSAQRLVLLE